MPRFSARSPLPAGRLRLVAVLVLLGLAGRAAGDPPTEARRGKDPDRSRAALHELRDTDLVSRGLILPFAMDFATPPDVGVPFETVAFPNDLGNELRGWFVDTPGTDRTVLVCMGNTGNMSHALEYARILHAGGFDALLFDYQGFGGSGGVASVFSLAGDASAAYRFLREEKKRGPRDIAILGISLGSMPALMLAEHESPAAVAIECLFAPSRHVEEMRALAGSPLSRMGVSFLEKFALPLLDPYGKLRRIACPIFFMHGVEDILLPAGASVEAGRIRPDARLWLMPDAGHSPELLVANDREHAHQIVRFLRDAFDGKKLANPEVSLQRFERPGEPRVVRVEVAKASPRRPLEIALAGADGGFEHVRLFSDAPAELRTLRPAFDPVSVHAIEPRYVSDRGDGTWSPELSHLSSSYVAVQSFERRFRKRVRPRSFRLLRQGDIRFGVTVFEAEGTQWVRDNLPDPGDVHPRIRPLYVPYLAELALGHPDEEAREALARLAIRFFPEDPGRHFELGNASFALGFDGKLPARVALLAARGFLREGDVARGRELALRYLALLPDRYEAVLSREAAARLETADDLDLDGLTD